MLKHVEHPEAGPLEFECQMLHIGDTGQCLIAYCAAPGSPTASAFIQLAAHALRLSREASRGGEKRILTRGSVCARQV
jgi:MmyB-like transcription regulator ligand binding domain